VNDWTTPLAVAVATALVLHIVHWSGVLFVMYWR
jgi:hypothetical protein